jgi:hypothetical protein
VFLAVFSEEKELAKKRKKEIKKSKDEKVFFPFLFLPFFSGRQAFI